MKDSSSKSAMRTVFPPYKKISGKEPPVRIFQRDWMEALTLISFQTFLIFGFVMESLVLIVTFSETHNFPACLWRFIAGLVVWEFFEYVMHRYIFHFSSKNPHIQKMVYIFHGNHHIQPDHPLRTIMPLIVTLPLSLLIWGISVCYAGDAYGSAFFAGFFLGYFIYDIIHYATHNFPMKYFPKLKKHHLLHHYRMEDRNYSISFPLLDLLFRTHIKTKRKK